MRAKFLLTGILAIYFFSANAQIKDRTEQSAKNKTNNRIDNKIDQSLDNGLDAIEGLFKKKDKTSDNEEKASKSENRNTERTTEDTDADDQSADIMNQMFGGGNVELPAKYTFDHNFILFLETTDKKGVANDPMNIKVYVSDEQAVTAMEIQQPGVNMFMIYDMENEHTVTLTDSDGQKMAMVFKLNKEMIEDVAEKNGSNKDGSEYKFSKTGKSKMISGHTCEEYKMENEQADANWDYHFWVTPDAEMDYMRAMSGLFASNQKMMKKYQMPENYPDGAMLQTVGESKKNDEKVVTTVKDIHMNDKSSISTSGYQVMDLSGMGGN